MANLENPPLRLSSAYLAHLSMLAEETRARTKGLPSFSTMLSLALFVHLAVLVPVYLFDPVQEIPPSKQVHLAFGVEKEQEPVEQPAAPVPPVVQDGSNPVSEIDTMLSDSPAVTKEAPKRRPETTAKSRASQDSYLPSRQTASSRARSNRTTRRPARSSRVQSARPVASRSASVAGNEGASQAAVREVISKYERLLSSWIDKHKIYPQDALQQGLRGQAVLRLRIDRRGAVLRKSIERSSGFPELDSAVLNSVTRAGSMPPVPQEYPGGSQLEFLIPVNFVGG